MVENYKTVDFYLERAADYEQKAERAVDPAARESFLEAAAKWRRSAAIYQSMKSRSTAPRATTPGYQLRARASHILLASSGQAGSG